MFKLIVSFFSRLKKDFYLLKFLFFVPSTGLILLILFQVLQWFGLTNYLSLAFSIVFIFICFKKFVNLKTKTPIWFLDLFLLLVWFCDKTIFRLFSSKFCSVLSKNYLVILWLPCFYLIYFTYIFYCIGTENLQVLFFLSVFVGIYKIVLVITKLILTKSSNSVLTSTDFYNVFGKPSTEISLYKNRLELS
jgi:hypothetical protein